MRAGVSRYPMTGRLGAARVLTLGLVLAVATLAALPTWSVAETKKHDRAAHGTAPAAAWQHKQRRKAKAAAVPQDKQRSKTKAVSEPNVTCNLPWNYSRALHHCICIHDGYTLQRGSCVRDLTSVTCRDDERWSPKRGACVCAKGLKRQGDACVVAEPVQIVVTPPPPEMPAPNDVFPVARLDAGEPPPTDVSAPVEAEDEQEPALSPEQVQAISRAQSCLT